MSGHPSDNAGLDYRSILESMPGLYLVLKADAPRYTVVAVSDAIERATMTRREEILGRGIFEVFPDNPAEPGAIGVKNLSQSLTRAIENRAPEAIALERHDTHRSREQGGVLAPRSGNLVASPVLGSDGRVAFLILGVDVRTSKDIDERGRDEAACAAHAELVADLDAMSALQEVGQRFLQEGNLEPVLTKIVDTAIAISGADFGILQLVDDASSDLWIAAQRGFSQEWVDFWDRELKGKGACGTALGRGERVIIEDVSHSPIFAGTPDLEMQLNAGVRAVQSTPMFSHAGKPLGMISTHYKIPYCPPARVLRLLDLLARQTADMLERSQTEAALRALSVELRQTIDTAATGLVHNSRDLRYLSVNAAYARWMGLPVDQLVGRSLVDVMGKAAFEVIRPRVERVLGGERLEYEDTLPIRGELKPIHVVYTPDVSSSGDVVGWVASVTDISDRKRAEAALRESQELLTADLKAMTALQEVGSLFIHEGNLESVLGKIVDTAIAISGADFGNIQLLDAQSSELRIAAQRGFPQWWVDFWNCVSKGHGVCGTALERGERVIVEDIENSPIFVGTPTLDIQRKAGVRAVQATPLVSRSGKLLGMFSTHYKTPQRPDARALRMMDLLARQAADILERSQSEEVLREREALRISEAKMCGLISIAADAIISIDVNQRITLFNEGAEKIFGYSRAEVLSTALELLIPERFRALHSRNIERFIVGQDSARRMGARKQAIFGLRKNGEEFPADAAISKLQVGGTTTLTVVLRDITEQKRIERQQHFLAEVGAVLASTLDYAETLSGIAKLAVQDLADICLVEVVEESAKVSRLIVHRDPAQTTAVDALRQIQIDLRRPRITSQVLEEKQPQLLREISAEYLHSIAQSDEHFQALCALHPQSFISLPLLAHGRLLGALLLISTSAEHRYGSADIPLAEELARRAALAIHSARLYRIAQQAVAARDDVLGIVAHDLRNPLNCISLQTQLLTSLAPESSRKPVDIILRSTGRIARLIQDLLDVARMEAGRLSVEPARVPTGPLVSEVVDAQQPLAAEACLKLRLELTPNLPAVSADRERLLQVFENLISNAIKFTAPGGSITIGAALADGAVRFWVADTGAGIPAENLPHLFDRFWQARRADRRGVGLGLPIAKGLVEAHGGRMWVESTPGRGSTFFFTVPVASIGAPARDEAAQRAEKRAPGVRILAVDDEAETVAALAALLTPHGFVVETANSASEALSKLARCAPDLLITDIEMPDLDGVALAAQARMQQSDLPVILITWLDRADRIVQAGLAQAHTHFVPKPIDLGKVLNAIDRALEEQPPRKTV